MSAGLRYSLPPEGPPSWAVGFGEDRQGVFAELPLLPDGPQMEMRWIPPGDFLMGSREDDKESFEDERPQHRVVLTQGFWLARTPCTVEQWVAAMGEARCETEGKEQLPVTQVSWDDCHAFCAKLGKETSGVDLRLPTEAEWEYTCRAGTDTNFNGGAGSALDDLGWYRKNSDGKAHPVGQKKANAFGLYDMHGNVWEWCADWYGDYAAESQEDPHGPDSGRSRVLRGGGFRNFPWICRSACRRFYDPSVRFDFVGFRLAAGQ